MAKFVSVGYFTGAHGVNGHVKLSTEVQLHKILKGTWCFVEIQKKPVPFFIEDAWGEAQNWVVKLRGCDKPEEARSFQGKRLSVDAKTVKAKTAFAGSELLGYKVLDSATNTEIGLVSDIFDNSGQMIIQVLQDDRDFLIPLHQDFVVDFNDLSKTLVLALPLGLLEL